VEAERVMAQAEARGLDIDEFQMLAIREAFRQAYSGHLAEARNISQNR
jgi:hypothetical protein